MNTTTRLAAPDGTAGVRATPRQCGNFRAWRAAEDDAEAARLHERAAKYGAAGDPALAALSRQHACSLEECADGHRRAAAEFYREMWAFETYGVVYGTWNDDA